MPEVTSEPQEKPTTAGPEVAKDRQVLDFALWLTPRGAERYAWRERIEAVAKLLGGPVFAPHVTLFGTFRRSVPEALVLAEALSRDLAPIPISGAGLGIGADPWQALYVPLVVNPQLWRARRRVCEVLDAEGAADFMPHLSLYYGDAPTVQKCQAVELLEPLPVIDWCAQELVLVTLGDRPERWSTEAILPFRG
ncbi:MAG: 2'-5' RNA ligase family protein [Acidobacteria bacterium]|nr:2'-5' RNA ligase family protein [Acidobacteriota bacterium]